jgi:hypothetical protein
LLLSLTPSGSHLRQPGASGDTGRRCQRRTSSWWAFFAEYWAEPEEFIDAGESVIVRIRQGGRGRSSAVGVEMPSYWQLYRLNEGRAVRVEIYREEADALEAAGLPE